MARRRASSKSDGFLRGLVVLAVIGGFIVNLVKEHSREIMTIAVVVALIWLGVWLVRGKRKAQGNALPAASAPPLPRLASRMQASQRVWETPSDEMESKSKQGPAPAVRITPLVDPPNSRSAIAKSGLRDARWVRPGETVTIQGITIASGLFYLGSDLPSDYFRTEYCLINPKLPISRPGDRTTEGNYYSSYTDFQPAQRRAFLEWMSTGRRDPNVDAWVVPVFLYGLEYRLFKQCVVAEAQELIQEAERLLEVYSENPSFVWSANKFVSYARAMLPTVERPPLRFTKMADDFPLDVRVFLGSRLVEGARLTGEDALLWAVALPNVWLRTPATRCQKEFEALWALRFAAKYSNGLVVRLPKSKISATYRSVSSTFQTVIHGAFEKLPDIAAAEGSAQNLKELVDACTNELDSYSRLLGRHPELTGKPEASLLLPEDLWAKSFERATESLAAFLGTEEIRIANLRDIMSIAQFPIGDASNKELAATLSRFSVALRPLEIGIEPDGSQVDAAPSFDVAVCLFKARSPPPGQAGDLSVSTAWRTAIDLALLGAATAGQVTATARGSAAAAIATDVGFIDPMRLRAYAAAAEPAGRLSKLLKAAGDFAPAERQSAARCAVAVALSGGSISPPMVKYLERLYKALNLSVDELYTALHRGEINPAVPTKASSPTDVAWEAVRRELEGGGAEPLARSGEVAIDPERLARARESTHAVSRILADVFSDNPSATETPTPKDAKKGPVTKSQSAIPGLDERHATLLSVLLDEGPLSRKDFEARARELRLLADGATEQINEWAFDRFDEPAIEDGETVVIVAHLHDRIVEMRGAGK